MTVTDIIPEAPLSENRTTEYKRTIRGDRQSDSWLRTVCGFANGMGGTIYIGVDDRKLNPVGFTRHEADEERNVFINQVNQHIVPPCPISFTFYPYKLGEEERVLIGAHVSQSQIRPVCMKKDGFPAIFMRRDGYTNGATPEEIRDMSVTSSSVSFDRALTGTSFDPADFRKLSEVYRKNNEGKTLTEKMLINAGFMTSTGLITKGAELFRDGYDGDGTMMKLFVWKGYHRGSRDPLTAEEYRGSILESIEYACSFISKNMNHTWLKLSDHRVDMDAFPSRAVFEGVVNAFAHRNYWLTGTHIQIDIFKNRLEITSPGNIFSENMQGKIYDISRVSSAGRNTLIAEILQKCRLMENSGTGFDLIADSYSDSDYAHRPFIRVEAESFTLVLPDLTYEDGVNMGEMPLIEFIPPVEESGYSEVILQFCWGDWKKGKDIADFAGLSDSTYFRNTILGDLEKAGLLKKKKEGRAFIYKTDESNVRKIS